MNSALWRHLIAASALLIALTGSAAAASSLCRSDETVAFSCQTRKGTASLCLAKAAGGAERLVYRFGSKDHVDLSYPKAPATPSAAFLAGTLSFSGGGGAYVQFANDAFRYTVFDAIGRWGKGGATRAIAGVAVARGDKEAANLACLGKETSELGPDLFDQLGLEAGDEEFEIPDAFTSN